MNNYSLTQQYFHKFALSSAIVKEFCFDLEKSLAKTIDDHKQNAHIFVSGLARAGTTILMRRLHDSGQLASLTYADMPFVMAPNLWARFHRHKEADLSLQERAHGDGIMVNTQSPEAFEEVFWSTFQVEPSYRILEERPIDDTLAKQFETFVNLVLHRYQQSRYLSKNNANILRINSIRDTFPNAKVLIPFRKPLEHAYSLLSQHKRFCKAQQDDGFIKLYMDYLGHHEFGLGYKPFQIMNQSLRFQDYQELNHWLEQWFILYHYVLTQYKLNPERLMCLPYEQLSDDYYSKLAEQLDLKDKANNQFVLQKRSLDEVVDAELLSACNALYDELISEAFGLVP